MAKVKKEEEVFSTAEGDKINLEAPEKQMVTKVDDKKIQEIYMNKTEVNTQEKPLISCLRNETIIVRFVPNKTGLIRDPKHVFYGGMGEKSTFKLVAPKLESGRYVNVLTNDEKDYLEHILGLEKNALSIYKSVDNYWDDRKVVLTKQDTFLHLNDPVDYISYKILLKYPDIIAKSLEELNTRKKATYKFVLTSEMEEVNDAIEILDYKKQAYILADKMGNDVQKITFIIKELSGKSLSPKVDKKVIAFNIDKIISNSADKFVKLIEDPYFDTKFLLSRAVQAGVVKNRNRYYYLSKNNAPMNMPGKEPTLIGACEYLNSPMYSEERFEIEAILDKK